MKEKRISSNWTKPMLILMILFWVIGIPVFMFSTGMKFDLEKRHVFVLLIYVVMVIITLVLIFTLADVKLIENGVKFKKIFGREQVYSFEQIGYPSSFRFKRLKFTYVEMKEKYGNGKTYLILNNNALLSGERLDAEEILKAVRKLK